MGIVEQKWPWFERGFDFGFPARKMPDVIERLRGTPARCASLVREFPKAILTLSDEETWSVQENLAHLIDLEPLWYGRVQDAVAEKEFLRDADLGNNKTKTANHNDQKIDLILAEILKARDSLVDLVESLPPVDWSKAALHPRLKIPMRVVDLCTFVADHDDYHLARARFLSRKFASRI